MGWSNPILIRPVILLAASFFLVAADLPADVPVPTARPDRGTAGDTAIPAPSKDGADTTEPDKAGPDRKQPETEAEKPAEKLPEATIDKQPADAANKPPEEPVEKAPEYVPPPIEKEDAALLDACFADLKSLGVTYREAAPVDDGDGCGIERPITVTALGNGVELKPEGTMRCDTARQLARWTSDVVIPMLRTARPGETLAGLDQASAYICRKRNSAETGKISEHARGNAVDIAGFHFKSGKTYSIEPRMEDSTMDGALQRAITAAACLYFTTVLDPSSDKAHETHLHLDVITRKNDYRYCW